MFLKGTRTNMYISCFILHIGPDFWWIGSSEAAVMEPSKTFRWRFEGISANRKYKFDEFLMAFDASQSCCTPSWDLYTPLEQTQSEERVMQQTQDDSQE